jgi:hypothetical protein
MNKKNVLKNILKNIFNHFKKNCKKKTNSDYEIKQYLFLLNYINEIIDNNFSNYAINNYDINNYNCINNDNINNYNCNNNINNINNNIEKENYLINKIINIYIESYQKIIMLFENYKQDKIIVDSILASITLKLFKSIKKSCLYHFYKSKLINFNLIDDYNKCKNIKPKINNNTTTRESAYPINSRPRGDKDLESVSFQQQQIQNNNLPAIWLLNKNNTIYILDGFHRIAACFIEKKYIIKAYMIYL